MVNAKCSKKNTELLKREEEQAVECTESESWLLRAKLRNVHPQNAFLHLPGKLKTD